MGILAEPVERRLPIGADVIRGRGVHMRVWAPDHRSVEVVLEAGPGAGSRPRPLASEAGGYFAACVDGAAAGTLYRFLLDGRGPFPDPASRFQPDGPLGPSEVIDPATFDWSDAAWPGVDRRDVVLYELHAGTFTPQGTWAAARDRLPDLADLGITVIELMPISDFAGRRGWGYDGVNLFAPSRLYGRPEEMRAFIDHAHALGIAVILDVVYNHLGPDGNVLPDYATRFLSRRHVTDWGACPNFDDDGRDGVRTFVLANAEYWIREFHLDGLRLDATQDIHDESTVHIIAELAERARGAAGPRPVLLVAENEPQDARLARPRDDGGFGLDALWNDDFHHAAIVALTGRRHAYYSDYSGTAREFVALAMRGFLYQGQVYPWQGKRRGSPARGLDARALVCYLENHDQIANSERGERLHRLASPAAHRALTAALLLGPASPLLFMGQEWNASAPFLFFSDHRPPLREQVRSGRIEFLSQFPTMALPEVQARIPDPSEAETFTRCRLDWSERERGPHAEALALHRDLIRLRRTDPTLSAAEPPSIDAAVLSDHCWVIRWFGHGAAQDRLLVVNLGTEFQPSPPSEPLLAPPPAHRWVGAWSSEDPQYGGRGTPPLETTDGWDVPGPAAVLLAPAAATAAPANRAGTRAPRDTTITPQEASC